MLKADNEALRLRLSENTELLRKASTPLEVQGLPAGQSSNFAAALKNPSKSTTNTDDDGIGRQSTKPFRLPQRSNLATATQPEPKRNDVDAEGFQTFTRKKRVKPTEGRNTVSKLSCVPRQPRRRALFISRLNPHTTESDITESLAGVLKGKWMKCTKLATKHDSYASFHLRELDFGNDFITLTKLAVEDVTLHEAWKTIEDLDIFCSVDYAGGFSLAVDAELIIGGLAGLAIKVNHFSGKGRVQFARKPYTHWSFAFYEVAESGREWGGSWKAFPLARASLRWYYDYVDGVCRAFIYQGCGGNENNFPTKRTCNAICRHRTSVITGTA
ncbi:hypothetical protein ISCGN_027228 [Ixodes scapularis]